MTIQVVSSTDAVEPKAAASDSGTEGKAAAKAENTSAPAAKAAEQKEASESDTEGKEAKANDKDDSENESEAEAKAGDANDSEQDKPKKKGGFQRRIDKLNAAKADAQREADYWKGVALKAQKGGVDDSSKNDKVETPKAASDGKPNPDSFDTHAEYVEALTDWKTEQKLKEREEKAHQAKLQTEQERLIKAHSDRVTAFAADKEDWDEVLESVEDVRMSPTVQELLISSENGPELMYELAKNRAELERICKLAPLAAARELGKIETRIGAKASPEEKKTEATKKLTKAPKPIEPVGGTKGTVAKSIYDPNLSQAEYERIRREQEKQARA